MITFLIKFDDGSVIPIQKEMTMQKAEIWAKENLNCMSHVVSVTIKEEQARSFDYRNLIFNKESFK